MQEQEANNVKSATLYPSADELELLILRLSPCSITDIIRFKKFPITSSSIAAVKRRLSILEDDGKILTKRSKRLFLIWHQIFEEARKKELLKRGRAMGLI